MPFGPRHRAMRGVPEVAPDWRGKDKAQTLLSRGVSRGGSLAPGLCQAGFCFCFLGGASCPRAQSACSALSTGTLWLLDQALSAPGWVRSIRPGLSYPSGLGTIKCTSIQARFSFSVQENCTHGPPGSGPAHVASAALCPRNDGVSWLLSGRCLLPCSQNPPEHARRCSNAAALAHESRCVRGALHTGAFARRIKASSDAKSWTTK
ncbi:hypothetical protein P7K49_007484 [Saguinus oedipus]|uniref:Uncharacterized protein n=1 Tax=Saguinus oedipus TaxID=9490 RepID=A0ABQ9VV07_SAGOE|nr:hypothetical protein P7K49_007484 [Saguinus oedipus]